ncbi:MAG: hypothetical protein NVSMB2_24620 [Chloroflexota bacterium]
MSKTRLAELEAELEQRTRELVATQAQLHSLIERNADAIVVVDEQGICQFVNPAAERLFRRRADALLGSALGLPLVVGETTDIDIVGEGSGVAEMRVVETIWQGAPALLAVIRDITDRKRAEQEREQLFLEQTARAQAEEALRERDDFLALASHELKTPVATLSATAQLLHRQIERQGSLDPDQQRRALERLHEQSRRLSILVEHLLDVSQINSGKLSVTRLRADLCALVSDVVTARQLTATHHRLVVRGPEHLEIDVDPVRVGQILTNLIDNAVKYSPDGGAIEIELHCDEASGTARISVRDHGIGIPLERRSRLFERFYRAHADGHVSGMGLGLFITHHLVELHGGDIEADSPADGGARFTVSLPLHTA